MATVAGVDTTDEAIEGARATVGVGWATPPPTFPVSANLAIDACRSQRLDDSRGVEGVEGGREVEGVGVDAITAVTAAGRAMVGAPRGAAERGRWGRAEALTGAREGLMTETKEEGATVGRAGDTLMGVERMGLSAVEGAELGVEGGRRGWTGKVEEADESDAVDTMEPLPCPAFTVFRTSSSAPLSPLSLPPPSLSSSDVDVPAPPPLTPSPVLARF